jgi:hypothetical protein
MIRRRCAPGRGPAKRGIVKKIMSDAEQALYQVLARIVAAEAPRDWTIAVLKFEIARSVPRQCRVTLEYVDSTGHVIWFEAPHEALHELGLAALRFHAVRPEHGGQQPWTRASLTVSPLTLISADFWEAVEHS